MTDDIELPPLPPFTFSLSEPDLLKAIYAYGAKCARAAVLADRQRRVPDGWQPAEPEPVKPIAYAHLYQDGGAAVSGQDEQLVILRQHLDAAIREPEPAAQPHHAMSAFDLCAMQDELDALRKELAALKAQPPKMTDAQIMDWWRAVQRRGGDIVTLVREAYTAGGSMNADAATVPGVADAQQRNQQQDANDRPADRLHGLRHDRHD